MNVNINIEKYHNDTCIHVTINTNQMMGHEPNDLFILGSCLIDTHKVIFDFSAVNEVSSPVIDTIAKIIKGDKKKHSMFIFSEPIYKLVIMSGLHQVIKIIN
jgi:hypothetical protein